MADSNLSLFARLRARPGKSEEVEELLRGAVSLAREEEGTRTWFALRFDDTTFGIFDTFNDESARQAHLDGEIAKTLMDRAEELLVEVPTIERIDVLAAKVP